ncbi:hypothetical protein ACFQE0_00865 [Methylobacterium komagatae]|uniref:Uncharacterized protein n=1 Tax=Methylobacterium komagatae TaxID=374425 RepID=A0ABW2BDC4_9HYPH
MPVAYGLVRTDAKAFALLRRQRLIHALLTMGDEARLLCESLFGAP